MQDPESAKMGQSIAVYGASGHTGRFVVAELQRRGFVPIAIGRHAARLVSLGLPGQAVEARVATVEEAASLDRALIGAVAVINCAGPFLDTADALAAAAVRARIHYLDVTPEQSSALATFERFAAPARAAAIIMVPAMGFYGGLGDLLATAAMGDWTSADEIRIGIALDSWQPTPGTRLTGQRNTARRLVIADEKLTPLADPAPQVSWSFADPFGVQDAVAMPMTETILISRHLRTDSLHTYLNLAPLRDLRDPSTPPPSPADDMGRSSQTFLIEVIVRKGLVERRASAQGRDIYAFTAPLVVEAVQRILAGAVDNLGSESGVFAPGEIFDAADFLRSLAPDHLRLEIG
ncbi:NAD(P)H-binding protein [Sphingomonas sp. So64.6b]|uniref:saccharopine dehydrogenase NADP-binding domain-containing protein n=1 Tax=Sphingomonas sp. So64.6b TaxID=2997354 RepID=UPI0016007B4E|nr:saccharopine dehydrogenase NADP-binding domain-containing protein [Sphingomonas sp. So64.6b]QNA86001.1 NAD(P)H-binding protein [Sphingomonas sp. So64.6b]